MTTNSHGFNLRDGTHQDNYLRKEMTMKRVEKFVLILSIVTAIKVCATPVITMIWKQQLATGTPQAFIDATNSIGWLGVVVHVLTNLICGIWLLFDSKEEKLSHWVWFLFGIVFGVDSIILFYLYILLSEIKLKGKRPDESAA
jgi:hypothetical protein